MDRQFSPIEWFYARAAKAQRREAPIYDVGLGDLSTTPPLCAGRVASGRGVLVPYLNEADEQIAFDIAASLLPEGVKLKWGGDAEWTYLRPTGKSYDSCGYIGWHLAPERLKPGEFVARVWTGTTPAEVMAQDVVVTREGLAELRASGKYWRVDAPDAEAAAAQH